MLPQGILAGKPVVSFDLDSADEAVVPGRNGYLVAPRDVEGLATAIDSVLLGRLDPWSVEDREAFVERFRAETMVAAIDRLYRRELKGAENQKMTG